MFLLGRKMSGKILELMGKNNYLSWHIQYDDFWHKKSLKEKLQFLIQFAVLAPSSHNSQPWKFSIHANEIALSPEKSRALPVSDSNERQLFISLGCALENLLIAADFYHLKTTMEYFPAPEIVCRVLFEESSDRTPSENHLALYIPKRATNRNKYLPRPIESDFYDVIKKKCGGSNSDISVTIVDAQEQRERLADIALRGLIAAMDFDPFRLELSQYVKSNITHEKVGMPGFCFNIPTPISLLAPRLIRRFNVNRITKKQEEAVLKATPAFVIISSRSDNKKSWIAAGQCFEHIALAAERSGIKTALLAAPVQIGKFFEEVQAALHSSLRPQVFFRMGYCEKIPRHSPRLAAYEVIGV